MAEQIANCPGCGKPGTRDYCGRPCCPDCGCGFMASREETWNRRIPGPATRAMLGWLKTWQNWLADTGFPDKPEPIFQAFLAEWPDPASPPPDATPLKPTPWKCALCGEPVRIADDLMPRHIRDDLQRTHAAELSDEDRKILADGLRLTD